MTASPVARRSSLVLLLIVALQPPGPTRGQPRSGSPDDQAVIERSAPIDNLTKRADEAVNRRDWKFAVDSLQRIIDDPKGALLERTPHLYEPARRWAERTLAAMPAEGLTAYRVLNDGRARRLLEQGIREHDVAALGQAAERYLLTSHGDDAAGLLASWLLDEGRPAEALTLLNRVVELYPDHDLPAGSVAARQALAWAMLGAQDTARALLNDAAQPVSPEVGEPLNRLIDQLAREALDDGSGRSSGRGSWRNLGGGGDRRNLMAGVAPTMITNLPWRHLLPDARIGDWADYLNSPEHSGAPPALHAVGADGRLFVKGTGSCAALELDTFELLWQSQSEAQSIAERYRARHPRAPSSPGADASGLTREERLRYDYVCGSLSVAGDLLLTVERHGRSEYFDQDGILIRERSRVPARPGQNPWNLLADRTETDTARPGNRLAAYDVRTGGVRWQRGRSGYPGDPLGAVEFLAAPLLIDRELWTSALINGDLFAVVLEPTTGRLLGKVMLCTPADSTVPTTTALWPALGGGTVYIPTGQGLLFAIDVDSRTPVWAARYDRVIGPGWRRASLSPRAWLSTPPVVSGPMVLLAPTDADALLAFDRTSGELRWSADRGNHRYIVAADNRHVWVAGDTLACRSTATGQVRWTSPPFEATGRAALSGSLIYVPTPEGLIAFDAESGRQTEFLPLPQDQPPLGNLLALGDSLISVDASAVRRFPDLAQSYSRALALFGSDPANVAAALRLARLELINGAPGRALAVLEPIPPGLKTEQPRLYRSVGRFRVEALIELAQQTDQPPEIALAHLERAMEEAVADEDRLAVGLALGQRLCDLGQVDSAYRCLWNLAHSSAADGLVASAGGVRRGTRRVIGAQLRELEPQLPAGALAGLVAEAAELVTGAAAELAKARRSSPAARVLQALGEGGAPGGWDQTALIELAAWQVRHRRYEPAEQNYLAAIRLDRQAPQHTARALAGLAAMYLNEDQSLAVTAVRHLDRLDTEFASIELDCPDEAGQPARTTGAELAKRLRAAADPALLAQHQAAVAPGAFRLTRQLAWPDAWADTANPRLVTFPGERPEALAERVLVAGGTDTISAYRLIDGNLDWEARLRLPDDLLYDLAGPNEPGSIGPVSRAVADGQTALIRGPAGLYALGMVTGKRLWAQPQYDPTQTADGPPAANLVSAWQGRVACVPESGVLAVLNTLDGSTIWRRPIDGQLIGSLRIHNDFLLVADDAGLRLQVFDVEDGRWICDLRFQEPNLPGPAVRLVYADGLACGPDGSAVVAYDLATGAQRWRHTVAEELISIFQASPHRLGAGTLAGGLLLVEIATGDLVYEGRLIACRNGVVDGVLDGDTLVVGGIIDTSAGRRPTLVGIDPAAGTIRWQRDDLALFSRRPWFFNVARGTVPALIETGDAARTRVALAVIDTRTGAELGRMNLTDAAAGEGLPYQIAAWPGRLVLGTTGGISVLRTTSLSQQDGP